MSGGLGDFVLECLEPLGGVSLRRFFGGQGLYRDGILFGFLFDDRLYLKSDSQTRPDFAAEECEPFRYTAKGVTREILSFQEAPERLLDEPDELIAWCRTAHDAARRLAASKPPKRKPRSKAL